MIHKLKNNDAMPSAEEVRSAISLLETLVNDSAQLAQLSQEDKVALLKAAGALSRPDKQEIRKRQADVKARKRAARVDPERRSRAQTGIRAAREASVFVAPKQIPDMNVRAVREPPLQTTSPRNCYICKSEFTELHFFYDALCPACAALNYQKRFQRASLEGQIALITGSRLKIGYQATLMMLRAGARVIATTRFPVDSALRYAREKDFALWKDRLHIYGLDLRHTPSVELFSSFI